MSRAIVAVGITAGLTILGAASGAAEMHGAERPLAEAPAIGTPFSEEVIQTERVLSGVDISSCVVTSTMVLDNGFEATYGCSDSSTIYSTTAYDVDQSVWSKYERDFILQQTFNGAAAGFVLTAAFLFLTSSRREPETAEPNALPTI